MPSGYVPPLDSYDLILLNSSGGKDSQATMDYVVELADRRAIPRERLVVLHADLGEMDWPQTLPTVERHARAYGLRLEVVRRERGNLLEHVEQRGMWPAARTRYCTSDHKTNPARKAITRLVGEVNERRLIPKGKRPGTLGMRPARILNVFGFREQESAERRHKLVFEREHKTSSGNRTVDRWRPIHDWPVEQVWERIRRSGVPAHPIYAEGLSRASCSLCVLASRADLVRAARLRPELAARYAAVERTTGHRFRNDISMEQIIDLARRQEHDDHHEEPGTRPTG